MSCEGKHISSPFSTGGGGEHFEAHVQASFALLMLTGGFAPCLPNWPIRKIKLQGRFAGYETDDLIVFAEKNGQELKILGQIKHSISITENDTVFGEVIHAAWNDFNNAQLFAKGKDIIVLITGPLSATDINDVRPILEWARHSESAEEFLQKVALAKFSSDGKRKKLKAFKANLKKANSDQDVSDDNLWEFLKHFHLLGYDLDIKAGVTLSLLHSLIGQCSQEDPHSLWTQIVDLVQSTNKNAGTISLEDLPEELRNAFKRRPHLEMPAELSATAASDWNQLPYAGELAIVNLIGSWDESNETDRDLITQVVGKNYEDWIAAIREILHLPGAPITLKNGKWRVVKRRALWQALGGRIFDEHLDRFKECAIAVLSEKDPKFDLPPDERYAATIYGKTLKHSPELRKGFSETLAILGNSSGNLTYCTQHKPQNISSLVVRGVLNQADWILWGSLNYLLPTLAEAAPDQFLEMVESALRRNPCPFDELFAQEEAGIFGENYLTGLLWAIETLAWEEEFLVRVCVILGELAVRDPGGNWSNRPINSLTTILLPWLPQTMASVDKRRVAVQTLQTEFPKVAWKLLLNLLPNQQQASMGTHKPTWRKVIPDDWEEGVTQKEEYWEQVSFYAELAVSMANDDIDKLNELVRHLDSLPRPSFNELLKHLSSDVMCSKPEEKRLAIWTELIDFAQKHRRFFDAKWALDSDTVSKIEAVAAKLAPSNPLNLHRRLFSDREFDLYEENGNWEEQRRKLEERRQEAIRDILGYGGMDAIIQFAKSVESPSRVGHSLGAIKEEKDVDVFVLPSLLETEEMKLDQFAGGYVWSRQYHHGWSWADALDKSDWTARQIGQFLSYLPFKEEAWTRATQWLGESEREYWGKVTVNPYQANDNLEIAIDKLIEHGRPRAALSCIHRMLRNKQSMDKSRIVRALLDAVSSEEPLYAVDTYHIVEIIKALQGDPGFNPDDLFRIEWAYLPLLDRHSGASPKLLEKRLATDPEFFCEVIRLIYRSKKESEPEKEPTEQEKSLANHAWKLLYEWRTPPGIQEDGSFSQEQFKQWLESVKKICDETGHLEVALMHIGQVLFYCPPDPGGLWIDKSVAEALNGIDASNMRKGFRTEAFNSRGAHTVDPTGKPERDLAEKYSQMAEDVENAGYPRFAATLRSLAETYEREAERIVAEHNTEHAEEEDE